MKAVLSGHELLITVTDTGIGIHEKELSHVFDRFFQASMQESAQEEASAGPALRSGGTGIGLSLTKELVLAMGCLGHRLDAAPDQHQPDGSAGHSREPGRRAGAGLVRAGAAVLAVAAKVRGIATAWRRALRHHGVPAADHGGHSGEDGAAAAAEREVRVGHALVQRVGRTACKTAMIVMLSVISPDRTICRT